MKLQRDKILDISESILKFIQSLQDAPHDVNKIIAILENEGLNIIDFGSISEKCIRASRQINEEYCNQHNNPL